jgi:hypothetical protein
MTGYPVKPFAQMLEVSILHRVLLRIISTRLTCIYTVFGSSESVCNVVIQTKTMYLEDLFNDSLTSAGLIRYKPLSESAESAMLAILTVDVMACLRLLRLPALQRCHADG